MKNPKIAIDASHFDESAFDGLNRYTGAILRAVDLQPGNFAIYTAAQKVSSNFPHRLCPIRSQKIYRNNFRGNFSRLLWHQTVFRRSLLQNQICAVYSPVPEGMLFPVCPQIITIHDLLPLFFPETYPRVKYYFQYILPQLVRASRAIVAVSEQTKQDIQRYFNCDRTPIHVVYQGYRSDIFNANPQIEDRHVSYQYGLNRFILCVGETRPYKNIRRLIQAFAQLKALNLELAIVGKLSKIDTTLTDLPQQLGIAEKVKFLGYVSDADLAALYRKATAFVFPSLYEGFGIPPLEAMACGCPAIVSQVASLPEVCGDGTYYINPTNIESIAEGIYRVATEPEVQNRLRLQGLNRVKRFQNPDPFGQIRPILDDCLSV